jgi:hypothetical protein
MGQTASCRGSTAVAENDRSPLLLPFGLLGLLLMTGLIAGGMLLGIKLRDFKRADRYVAVKGLVERTVKSDSATWPIVFSDAGDNLQDVAAASDKDKNAVLAFLTKQGFAPADVTVGAVSVTDRSAQQFNSNEKGPRFVVQQTVTVESTDVDKVAAANARTFDLIRSGIILDSSQNGGQGSGVVYKFNGLNALKPDMITEATRNARASADRFAADSGSQVGAIRDANQGTFSISAANAGPIVNDDSNQYSADQQADASMMKKVRVVATIDYYLLN